MPSDRLEVEIKFDGKTVNEAVKEILRGMSTAEVTKAFERVTRAPAHPFGTLITRGSVVSMYIGRSSRHVHETIRISGGLAGIRGMIDRLDDDVLQFWEVVEDE